MIILYFYFDTAVRVDRKESNCYHCPKVGTHIENVVRALHKPVLITSALFSPPKSFLIAFDGSQTARICVEKIANSPLLKNLTAHVVYVGKPNSDMTSQVTWAKELLANNGFNVIDIVLEGDVEKSILDYQEKNAIDMMVVGAYGHSKIRQFFIGSTRGSRDFPL